MGGGWLGGGWQGGGWQGGGWQGGGWQGGGWAGGGGGDLFAMRVDQPMVAKTLDAVPPPTPKYPDGCWDNDLLALTILPEVFRGTVGGQNWHQYITGGPTPLGPYPPVCPADGVPNPGDDLIDDLRILAVTERPEAMGEILDQANNQQLCFMNLLMMTASSHPKTFFAMKLAARVAETMVMCLKREYNRPRPTQYCPALYPPLPVPLHGAYPAGHAFIATITAEVLKEATVNPATSQSPYANSLDELARRIGFNRVIAGLHFKSDISAGNNTGLRAYQFLRQVSPAPPPAPPPWPAWPLFTYGSIMKQAQKEWFS